MNSMTLPAELKVAECDCELELEAEYEESEGYITVTEVRHEGSSLNLPDSMLTKLSEQLSTLKLGD